MNIYSVSEQKHQANFLLKIETIRLLKQYVPNKKQSAFVEELITRELKKQNFLTALKKAKGSWKNHRENSESFIRSLRESKRI